MQNSGLQQIRNDQLKESVEHDEHLTGSHAVRFKFDSGAEDYKVLKTFTGEACEQGQKCVLYTGTYPNLLIVYFL